MTREFLSSAERRAHAILDAYGSQPQCWPEAERQHTLDCIAGSVELQAYLTHVKQLDAHIHSARDTDMPSRQEVYALQQRILSSLPTQATSPSASSRQSGNFLQWLLMPRLSFALLGTALLALVFIVHNPAPHTTTTSATTSYAAWSWYDITGQELSPSSRTTAMTMTDLVDLEMDQGDS